MAYLMHLKVQVKLKKSEWLSVVNKIPVIIIRINFTQSFPATQLHSFAYLQGIRIIFQGIRSFVPMRVN